MLDVEVTRFAEYEGNPVREALIVVGRDYVYITCGRERTFRWIRQCGKDGGGTDDVEFLDVKTASDLEDHVL